MPTILGYRDEGIDDGYEEVNSLHPLPVYLPVPPASAGWSVFSLNCAATNNLTLIKSGPTVVGAIYVYNNAATPRLIRVYDSNLAPVVAADAVKIKMRLGIPSTATTGAGSNIPIPMDGVPFINGLGISITTVMTSDTDATSPSAGDVLLNILYK